uniref:Prostasin-like protein n=1 Tax=Callorhinchus milii TaxID=7868 RepID=V9L7A7_CALMI
MARSLSLSVVLLSYVGWCQAVQGCGKPRPADRIVGGAPAQRGEWPWQVSIHEGSQHVCGGSLISASWVISAAHCFETTSSDLTVFLGRHQQSWPNRGEQARRIKQILTHYAYRDAPEGDDIALVELLSPVQFTDYIQPVCLPAATYRFACDRLCWVTGWGQVAQDVNLQSPGTLQELQVPLIGSRKCTELYNVGASPDVKPVVIKPSMLCAGYPQGIKDSCQGDSGGPLVCERNGTWVLAGIVSWGEGCARPNRPGVYTQVTSFQGWIQARVGGLEFVPGPENAPRSVTCGQDTLWAGASLLGSLLSLFLCCFLLNQ